MGQLAAWRLPACVQRQLIVRKHIGALLRRRPACRNHDRDFVVEGDGFSLISPTSLTARAIL